MNQLQEQLRCIEHSIIETKKKYGCLTDEGRKRLTALRNERARILHELGDTLQ